MKPQIPCIRIVSSRHWDYKGGFGISIQVEKTHKAYEFWGAKAYTIMDKLIKYPRTYTIGPEIPYSPKRKS
jgi:hypothetical protein